VTPIYHITHIANLPEIIINGGLYCDAEMVRRGLQVQCIAYSELKERRSRTSVPVSEGGTLADYVPFYFTNRSPMLFAIHTNSVKSYCDGQGEIVYLVSSAEKIDEKGLPFCFTDGHAVEAYTEFYSATKDLQQVDWEVIENWSWRNRDDDTDRKRRKQAEFLVHNFFPWELVDKIGVIDDRMKSKVTSIVSACSHKPLISTESGWYY